MVDGPTTPGETLAEIAERHHRPYSTVRNRWRTHPDWPTPSGKDGRHLLFDPAAVDAWVLAHTTRPPVDLEPTRLYTAEEIATAAGLTAATIRADLSRNRWPAPDDTTHGVNRWKGATATETLGRRKPRRTATNPARPPSG